MNQTVPLSTAVVSSSAPKWSRLLVWIETRDRALLILLVLATGYRLLTFGHADLRGYDEVAYGYYAETLGQKGIEGIRSVIQGAPQEPDRLLFPMPFRILYVAAGWMSCEVLGSYDRRSLAWLSFGSSVALVGVGFLLLREWLSPHAAFVAGLFLITSPLATALSRRALQDGFVALVIVLSIWLFHRCWTRRRWSDWALWGVAVLAGLLTKETTVLLIPCFGLAALYYRRTHGPQALSRFVAPLLLAFVVYLAVEAWMSGGLDVYFRTYMAYAAAAKQNDYSSRFHMGPWFSYLILLPLLAPVTCFFSLVGAVTSGAPNEDRTGKQLALIYVVSGLVLFTALVAFNVRYVLFLDLPLRVLAVIGIFALAARIQTPSRRTLVTVALVLLALATDVQQYQRIFVEHSVYDPFPMNLVIGNGFWK